MLLTCKIVRVILNIVAFTKSNFVKLNKKMFNELNMKQKIIDQLQSKIFEITMRKPVIIPIISDLSKTKETN